MSFIRLFGGRPLSGRVRVGSAKNAVLPILAATLLTAEPCVIEALPHLEDVETMLAVLGALGASVSRQEGGVRVLSQDIDPGAAPDPLVRRMRASVLVAGPLLARFGETRVALPGGCAIGSRPIDLHLKGLEALGCEVTLHEGGIHLSSQGMAGTTIYLDFPSVGATENLMMAACLTPGHTILENTAEEPEVVDLANFLAAMGAHVRGAGTRMIRIEGVARLHGATYTPIPDRIEAGTYLLAALATRGEVTLENGITEHLRPLLWKLKETGAWVDDQDGAVHVSARHAKLVPTDVKTMPYPGFPTDLQAPMMAFLSTVQGTSALTETVFENRFMHVGELQRMGAHIKTEGRVAIIQGVGSLHGAAVHASDLRAGAALVIAGLAADGCTEIHQVEHLDRGYELLEDKLAALGADVRRIV